MRLFDILLEAIDAPNLDGVEVYDTSQGINYSFSYEDQDYGTIDYDITLYRQDEIRIDDNLIQSLRKQYSNQDLDEYMRGILYSGYIDMYAINDAKAASVILDNSKSGLNPTNVGNWSFVYNKLAGALIDAIKRKNYKILVFSGYKPGMDLVYTRMMSKFNRTLPTSDKFVQISPDTWMQQSVIDNADDSLLPIQGDESISVKRLLEMSLDSFQKHFSNYWKQLKKDKIRGY